MICEACKAKLLDYEAEALEPSERAEVAQHLLGCATCRAELEQLRLGQAHLVSWPESEPPPGLAARTLAALEQQPVAMRGRRSAPPPQVEPHLAGARPPRRLFRPLLSPIAACAVLACFGYATHVGSLQVRLGAEVYGAETLSPESSSLVRLALFDVQSHRPLADRAVKVELRDEHGKLTPLFTGSSDEQGQVAARLQLPSLPDGDYALQVRALDGEDSTTISAPVKVKRSYRLLLSSDKPMYQPGQTVHARVLANETANHQPPKRATVTFSAFDPRGSRIFKKEVAVDAFGVAAFDLPLAAELEVGSYMLAAELGDTRTDLELPVARYSLPRFEVKLDVDQPFLRPGQTATGQVKARRFAGQPVAGARIELHAGVLVDGFREVAAQTVTTDADGLARFELAVPSALPGSWLASGNAVLQLTARARDAAGEEVEKYAALVVARERLSITAVPENGTLTPGLENRLLVLVARPDGQPAAHARVLVDGTGQSVLTDEDGVAPLTFLPRQGRRDLSLTVVAPDGARVSKVVELTAQPSFAILHTEHSLYGAGETVVGTVAATSATRTAYLDVVADGRTVLTQTVDLAAGPGRFAFNLPPEVVGAVTLELYAQNGGELQRARRVIYVEDPRGLKVDLSVERDPSKPGESGRLKLHVADEHGKPVAAGVGVSVVDESVFALAARDPAMLRAFLNLADELRAPRFALDTARVVSSRDQDAAAELLFSAAEPQPTVQPLGHTSDEELGLRRAALVSLKDKRTATAWFAGLFMLGLMLEGVLRLFAARLLDLLITRRWGWVVLGTGASFVVAYLLDGSTTACVLASLLGLTGTIWAVSYGRSGDFRWARFLSGIFVMVFALVSVATLFGDNLRRMFGASVDALAGAAPPNTNARRSTGSHQSVTTFGSQGEDPKPAPAQDLAENLAQHLEHLGHGLAAGEVRRMNSLATIKGTGAATTPPQGPHPALLSAEQKARLRVRDAFPETLFWAPEIVTDGQGDATVELPAADSMTAWRATAIASTADGRLGTASAAVDVSHPFFVDLDLPPVLTVGDEVEIPIAVHNRLDHPETVTVEVEPADWHRADGPRAFTVTAPPGQVAGVAYRFTATAFGKRQPLTVYVVGPQSRDAVRREVEVRPAGVAFDQVANGTAEAGAVATLHVPEGAVPGAMRAELRLYPSTFAAVIAGLEDVLSTPSGSFQQTSGAAHPDALVLRYLRDQKRGSPELLARGERLLTTGYQRLLSFEGRGGGFASFGRSPASEALTAYALLELRDLAAVFPVDEQLIERNQQYLLSLQRPDGSWPADGERLKDDLFLGPLTTTAYVTWALAESGYRGLATERAARYLESRVDESPDLYTRALIANALSTLGSPSSHRVVDQLMTAAVRGPKGTLSFPARGRSVGSGESADVETTALVASALLRSGEGAAANGALKWLLAARDPQGGWGSTQATVLALRALLEASRGPGPGGATGTLQIASAARTTEVRFSPDQADVVQRVDVTDLIRDGELELRFSGDAAVSYQLELSGYRPGVREARPALSLDLGYDRATLGVDDTVQARLTATYQREGASGMVVIQAAIPPGFELQRGDLDALVANGRIAGYSSDATTLTLDVDALRPHKPLTLGYRLRARYPVRVTAPAASAYLSAQPGIRAESQPRPLTVTQR